MKLDESHPAINTGYKLKRFLNRVFFILKTLSCRKQACYFPWKCRESTFSGLFFSLNGVTGSNWFPAFNLGKRPDRVLFSIANYSPSTLVICCKLAAPGTDHVEQRIGHGGRAVNDISVCSSQLLAC